ncbi:binding-protein-dependent transport systems inner membrane component [Pyrolobus fumarii 1A]|uniref:Binding-protein-dependent transport systems inner membrane component n=1 Tax=Pyrolobus fumarii (strain DSM 11204 / 1A) TaxID=694429 RepID=G0EE58_PYRF1|nr:carbohydrate ABC transporter permease [Pyrolobus fumarii]AEM38752.1 binding-protein-dependent transport systems inner membrane component [Pyrolobus fumarii 1A]
MRLRFTLFRTRGARGVTGEARPRDVETLPRRNLTLALALGAGLASIPLVAVYVLLVLTSFSDTVVTGVEILEGRLPKFTLRYWEALLQGRLSAIVMMPVTIDVPATIVNTLIIALGVSLVTTLASTMAGYAFSRMKFAGREKLMEFIILLHAFPGVALLIGVFFVYVWMLRTLFVNAPYESRVAFVFAYTILARASLEIPMSIWLMKGFFDRIPWEVEWSALVDGASRIRTWWKVILPQVKPGIAALAIFSFLAGWEDFIYVYVFLYQGTGGAMHTLATMIEQLTANLETAELPLAAAAGVLYLLPTILFFLVTQKLLLETYGGGVKG